MPRADFEKRLADISYDPRAQVLGTVLQGVDAVKDGIDVVREDIGSVTDGLRDVFGRLDPRDLQMDVRLVTVQGVG